VSSAFRVALVSETAIFNRLCLHRGIKIKRMMIIIQKIFLTAIGENRIRLDFLVREILMKMYEGVAEIFSFAWNFDISFLVNYSN
jgi:hypothetical protein